MGEKQKISLGQCMSAEYNHILTTIGSNSPVVKKDKIKGYSITSMENEK